MLSKKPLKEAEAEKVRNKVDKMYENYGIAVDSLDDGDISRVYRHYFDNREELDADYEKSKKYIGQFDEDDII
jgi:uncharacterized protein YpuA (DUF1002 family)